MVVAFVAGLFPVLPSESRAAEPEPRIELAPIGGIASSRTALADEAVVKPHELVVAAGPIDELASYAEAQRELLERAWGVPVTDLRTAADADAETSEEAEPRSDSRQLVPITSSDLSGDGHEDVVYFDIGRDENSFMSDVSLSAHDGRSGRLLWSHDYGLPYNLLVLSPGDVTGDGRDDVLVVAIAQSWTRSDIPCAQPACAYDDILGIEWGVALLYHPMSPRDHFRLEIAIASIIAAVVIVVQTRAIIGMFPECPCLVGVPNPLQPLHKSIQITSAPSTVGASSCVVAWSRSAWPWRWRRSTTRARSSARAHRECQLL